MIAGSIVLFSQAVWAQTEKAIIGYPSRSYNILVLHVAEVKGFFREEKLEPVIVQIGGGTGITALMSGDLHYYWNFTAPIVAVMNQGVPVKIIAIFNTLLHQVVARPEIKSAVDLHGKRFGVTRIQGPDHLQAMAVLQTKGADPKKINFVNFAGGDPARVVVLRKGLVDAIAVSPPNPYTLQKEGYNVIGGPRDLEVPNLASALSTTDQRLKQQPDHVQKVLRALLRGLQFVRANRDETIKIMMRWLNESQEIASASYDTLLPELSKDGTFSDTEIQHSIEGIKMGMGIGSSKSTSLSQFRDFTVLRQVQKELGNR
jgi:ABC-type nitrate/sulfonate/bicarbonate transport system substrate-binding protein